MSRALADLLPKAQEAATLALDDLKARGIPYYVHSTLRTMAEQKALYAQGRVTLADVNRLRLAAGMAPINPSENLYTVTRANGVSIALGGTGRSAHQLGTALDVVPLGAHGPEWPGEDDPRWYDIAQSFESRGFEWGGRWPDFPDLPHYTHKGE